jgi:hypothetical protein
MKMLLCFRRMMVTMLGWLRLAGGLAKVAEVHTLVRHQATSIRVAAR